MHTHKWKLEYDRETGKEIWCWKNGCGIHMYWDEVEHLLNSHADLLEACEEALNRLENMTTEEFKLGADHVERDLLKKAIEKAKCPTES